MEYKISQSIINVPLWEVNLLSHCYNADLSTKNFELVLIDIKQ